MTEEQLRALGDFAASDLFSPAEKLVLRYADGMTRTPVDVPDDLFVALKAEFSPKQLVELTSAIAWENYRARFDHAFGVEAAGFTEGAFCPVPVAS